MQTDHQIPARRPDLEIVNKKENLPNSGLCHPGGPQNDSDSDTIYNGALGTISKSMLKRTGRLRK